MGHRAEAFDRAFASARIRAALFFFLRAIGFVEVGHAHAHDFAAHLVVHGRVRARRARAVDAHDVDVRGEVPRGVEANLQVRVRARQAQAGLAHLREAHEMRGGHVAVHDQRLAAEVLVHGLGNPPRARHARAAPLEHVHDRGGGRRLRVASRRHAAEAARLGASKPSEGSGRAGVGGADGGRARHPTSGRRGWVRAGSPGSRAETVDPPERARAVARGFSAGRARREVCDERIGGEPRAPRLK